MTDRYLKLLINKLNNKKTDGLIFLRPLSDTVDFAKVWTEKPRPTDNITTPDGPFKFYFIKNNEGFYVATILDMRHDLHWFVLPSHRKQGHLTKALKDIVLFHLFQDRKEQRVTIKENIIGRRHFLSSEKVAINLGFIKLPEEDSVEYVLYKENYKTENNIKGHNTEITKERLEELRNQINYISRLLWIVKTEIEMKLDYTDYSKELQKQVNEIRNHTWKLEDVWWKEKNKM